MIKLDHSIDSTERAPDGTAESLTQKKGLIEMKNALLVAGVVLAALPTTVSAQRVQSGTRDGISYTATSRIVGQTSTATIAGGGNPIYLSDSRHTGTVALIMEYSNGTAFICSGSLMNDRRSIVTAGHCVSDGGPGTSSGLVRTTAYFGGGQVAGDFFNAPGTTAIAISDYYVNANYTGEVIDQNDIAVLRLSGFAPTDARSYGLYLGELTGQQFNVAGFGGRSDTGGSVGSNLGTGRLRQGDNIYDYALGNAAFDGFFTDIRPNGENFFGTADIRYSYVSDFDNGTSANDASCAIAAAVGAPAGFGCNTGLGAREVGIAGGDSGGPGFINGQLASVNSYGLSFGSDFGDIDDDLNDTFGEFSGYVPVSIHADFITSAMGVPEPATWAMMILGMGAVGGAMRRRRSVAAKVRFA